MSNNRTATSERGSPEEDLRAFIERFAPSIARRASEALTRIRSFLPGAVELFFDNYNALVIGFGPISRASDAVVSIVLYQRKVVLCFLWGAELPDPDNVLRGTGARARTMPLVDPQLLDQPAVQLLVDQAASRVEWTRSADEPIIIVVKSVSARQRPRRVEVLQR